MDSTRIGRRAESLVATYLERAGYVVLEQNWRTPLCEIDVVANKNDCVFMVEVKYRTTTNNGDGFDAITPKKLHQMKRAAEIWVSTHHYDGDYQCLAAAVDAYGDVELVFIVE